MRIVALDPGKTTGICSLVVQEDCFDSLDATHYPIEKSVAVFLDHYKPDVVIYEAFRLYPWKSQQLSFQEMPAVEVIGVIKTWCNAHGIVPIEQPASSRMMMSKEWLQKSGLWKVTIGLPHARDAARHLLYYCSLEYPDIVKGFLEGGD